MNVAETVTGQESRNKFLVLDEEEVTGFLRLTEVLRHTPNLELVLC